MRILFQGDSITDGNRYKDEEHRWDLNHQIGHSYAFIVSGLMGLEYARMNMEFVNAGFPAILHAICCGAGSRMRQRLILIF